MRIVGNKRECFMLSEEGFLSRCEKLGIENEKIVFHGFSGFVTDKLDYIEFPGGELEHTMFDKTGLVDAHGVYHFNACENSFCCGPCALCARNSEVRVFGVRSLLQRLSDNGWLCGLAETAANFIGIGNNPEH